MTTVCGCGCEGLATQGGEVVFTHKPLHPLGIHDYALPPELGRDAPVAVKSVAQAQRLNLAQKISVGFAWSLVFKASIIACTRDAGQPAQPLDISAFNLVVHHGFDDRDDAV